ncbi:C69 family dipeptidase [Cellulomonas sp. Leaf334]|uniref:C69 family dipeptidase n=1 Tax=Cellulomonas sp. Leaf334 TaxID=1736339 RepID=UPI0007014711|nr:C69 family dipeptidase [Cellulomonas sp. Leaf334]KQR08596.1 hypothetical protein ASF78_20375 [Cellulomonas sp. Leaf334]
MCTSVACGTGATQGGVVLLARNEDFTRMNWNKMLTYREVPEYLVPGSPVVDAGVWTLGNGLRVPVPTNGFAYSAMPDAAGATEAGAGIGDHFFFEERGINARNVAMSATNSMATNAAAMAADPYPATGVAESIMTTLILPQAESARHGVLLLGSYVQELGASEPNGVLIADASECWYVEIGTAHHWLAARIPDDCYVAVANGLRIHDVDLDGPGVLSSPGLFEFVVDHGLLAAPDRHRFDFARAVGVLGVPYNTDRVWLAQLRLSPSLHQPPRLPQYPLFLRPDAPISAEQVMSVLRATYVGTVLEGKADRPIGYEKTAESHIITMDPHQPPALTGSIWQAISTPLGAPYLPLHNVPALIPAAYTRGANEFSHSSAYWAFHGAHALERLDAQVNPGLRAPWWPAVEQEFLREAPLISALLRTAHAQSPETAVELAARLDAGTLGQGVELAHRATAALLTEMAASDATLHALAITGAQAVPSTDLPDPSTVE